MATFDKCGNRRRRSFIDYPVIIINSFFMNLKMILQVVEGVASDAEHVSRLENY